MFLVEGIGDDAWAAFAAAAATIAAMAVLTTRGGATPRRPPPRAEEDPSADGSSSDVDCPVCLERVPCGGVRAPCAHGACAPCFARTDTGCWGGIVRVLGGRNLWGNQ